jgi:hypothetical protein
LDAWSNPGGPAPDDPEWLVPQHDQWSWDADALLMGEQVGFPLYLRLRDRLCELNIPTVAHDVLIQEMIDCHDVGLIERGTGLSTLVFRDDGTSERIEMAVVDQDAMGPLSALAPGHDGPSPV